MRLAYCSEPLPMQYCRKLAVAPSAAKVVVGGRCEEMSAAIFAEVTLCAASGADIVIA